MHSITMNWEYRPKFHFLYEGTSYCFSHDESFRKKIHVNGLDMSLSIADIYGTITVEQINSGKHVYRSFEGYLILCLSLYKIFLQKFIDGLP